VKIEENSKYLRLKLFGNFGMHSLLVTNVLNLLSASFLLSPVLPIMPLLVVSVQQRLVFNL
jgi:hypothetical protein